jgi:hypothetical protein
MELCALAGAGLDKARAYVAAQAPPAKVRSELAAARAATADAAATDAHQAKAPSATAGWDEAVASANRQLGFK